jgi:hypothetical protein
MPGGTTTLCSTIFTNITYTWFQAPANEVTRKITAPTTTIKPMIKLIVMKSVRHEPRILRAVTDMEYLQVDFIALIRL